MQVDIYEERGDKRKIKTYEKKEFVSWTQMHTDFVVSA